MADPVPCGVAAAREASSLSVFRVYTSTSSCHVYPYCYILAAYCPVGLLHLTETLLGTRPAASFTSPVGLELLERPGHGVAPVCAQVSRDGVYHAGAGVAVEPKVAMAVQQDTVVGEDDERFWLEAPQDVDVLCADGHGEGGRGGGARVGVRVGVEVKGPLEALDGVSAGAVGGGAQVRGVEQGEEVCALAAGVVVLAAADDALVGVLRDVEEGLELRVDEVVPGGLDDGADAAVQAQAVGELVDEDVEVGRLEVADRLERLGEVVQAEHGGEKEPRDGALGVVEVHGEGMPREAGESPGLEFRRLVAQRGDVRR